MNCVDREERKEIELLVEKIDYRPDKRAIALELKRWDGSGWRRFEIRRVAAGFEVRR